MRHLAQTSDVQLHIGAYRALEASNLCTPVGPDCSPPLRGLERLRSVDIKEGAVTFDRDFRYRLAVP
jgi:hypothetical protein